MKEMNIVYWRKSYTIGNMAMPLSTMVCISLERTATYTCVRKKGWKWLVRWKGSEISWNSLKDIKVGDPIIEAKYDVANKFPTEPAFSWWAPDTLRRRD